MREKRKPKKNKLSTNQKIDILWVVIAFIIGIVIYCGIALLFIDVAIKNCPKLEQFGKSFKQTEQNEIEAKTFIEPWCDVWEEDGLLYMHTNMLLTPYRPYDVIITPDALYVWNGKHYTIQEP